MLRHGWGETILRSSGFTRCFQRCKSNRVECCNRENLSVKLFSLVSPLQDPVWPVDSCRTWYSHIQVNRKAFSTLTQWKENPFAWIFSNTAVRALTTRRLWLGKRKTWGRRYTCHRILHMPSRHSQDLPITMVNWHSIYKICFQLLIDLANFNLISWGFFFLFMFVSLVSVLWKVSTKWVSCF